MSVNIMGQSIHITLSLAVPLPPPPLSLHPYYRNLENSRNFLPLQNTGKLPVEVVHEEYLGHMPAPSTWICFIKLGLLSPSQSSVDKLILSKCLEIYLS